MHLELDENGFLKNKDQWNEAFVVTTANKEQIALTVEHWEIIRFFRHFYEQYQLTPAMRVLMKHLRPLWSAEKVNSTYLQTLFPKGVMLQASRLAGLPKPSRCL